MKNFNKNINSGWPIWKIWIWSVAGVFTLAMISFGFLDYTASAEKLFEFRALFISSVFGLIFGSLFPAMISMSREADKFHEEFDKFDKKLEDAMTQESVAIEYERARQWYITTTYTRVPARLRKLKTVAETKQKVFEKLELNK